MSQFRKADSSVYATFLDMIEKVFPELTGYSFGLLYREKMKKSRGGIIMAEICRPTKLLSYFAKNDAGNPFDFLIIVDEMAWCCAKECDRIRLMRHELRHIHISDKGVAGLLGHDYQDFYAEVEINIDDPTWAQKLAAVILAGYDQVKDGQRDPRTEHQGKEEVTEVTKDPERQTKLAPHLPTPREEVVEAVGKEFTEKTVKSATDVIMESLDATSKLDDLAKSKGLKDPIDESAAAANVRMANTTGKAAAEKANRVSNFQ